jgi:hypothetical protein
LAVVLPDALFSMLIAMRRQCLTLGRRAAYAAKL